MTLNHITEAAMIEFATDRTNDFSRADWMHLMVCEKCRAALVALLMQAETASR
jgi:hypothetical protein